MLPTMSFTVAMNVALACFITSCGGFGGEEGRGGGGKGGLGVLVVVSHARLVAHCVEGGGG